MPLIDGVYLTSLGGTLTVGPPPTTITGTAGIAFGPTVNSTTLSATGTLTRTLPGSGTSGSYTATGTLTALSQLPDGGVGVRDSKNPTGPVLQFTPVEWHAFPGGARNGEFDRIGWHEEGQ